MTHFIYLHGLASGPNSKKASAFKKVFEQHNLPLTVPDLECGGFENLTISKQMKILESLFSLNSHGRYGIIGSSLGGFLAALVAEINISVSAIYLMAPAFDFLNRWRGKLTYDHKTNKFPGFIKVFHYRYNSERLLNTQIFKDAEQWENLPLRRKVPTRLVHGVHDKSVDIRISREFSAKRSWCEFLELDSDHGLLSHLNWLIDDCQDFFKKNDLM